MSFRNSAQQGAGFKTAVIVCAVLVGLALSLQAAHVHLDAKSRAAKHCSICSGVHIALPSAQGHIAVANVNTAVGRVVIETYVHVQFHSFSLFNRPPPSA